MPRGRKPNVTLINQWEDLLRQLVLPRFDAIDKNLLPRVDRLELDVREHSGQIRELYSICAVLREQQEKKSS